MTRVFPAAGPRCVRGPGLYPCRWAARVPGVGNQRQTTNDGPSVHTWLKTQ